MGYENVFRETPYFTRVGINLCLYRRQPENITGRTEVLLSNEYVFQGQDIKHPELPAQLILPIFLTTPANLNNTFRPV